MLHTGANGDETAGATPQYLNLGAAQGTGFYFVSLVQWRLSLPPILSHSMLFVVVGLFLSVLADS